ncbi:transcriptional regulator [Seonamhaeicola marinus]|uniref:Transcriptional regulator n=1 Tax=Seonamhaeicola marinus TaxID=1912246 RepID=A0A5D0J793_9FLAO|nr:transcriptional regulator [Seonamhaeicola marinus]TYA92235.1 transcriptional regulator [Seonamhaeicola marinus]
MTSVITGDIIKSRGANPNIWMDVLKNALTTISPNTAYWEVYRGDSFQIEIPQIANSFLNAIYIKACIKTIKGLDVRLAIGIGNKTYNGKSVTESNGEAFIFSGETLESLKKEKQNLLIKTPNNTINKELNLYFKLALTTMDSWTVNSAETVKLSIEHPKAKQKDLSEIIGTKQDAISKRQKRAGLEHMLELNQMYQQKLSNL